MKRFINRHWNYILLVVVVLYLVGVFALYARQDGRRSPVVGGGGGAVGNADTLDTLDSLEFLRSDIGDTHGGGTLTIGTVDVNGGAIDGAVLGAAALVTGDLAFDSVVGLDVRVYGATGDGVTDDTAAIQATITAAAVGETVFVPKGDYVITSPITINKVITFCGQGPGSQIYQSADEHLLYVTVAPASQYYLRIEDLHLGSAATTAGKSVIELVDSHDVRITNVLLKGGYYGIDFNPARRCIVSDIQQDTWGPTLFFGACSATNTIFKLQRVGSDTSSNNTFIGLKTAGIGAVNGWDIDSGGTGGKFTIIGCTAENLTGYAFKFTGVGTPFVLIGFHCEANGVASEIINCIGGEVLGMYNTETLYIKRSSNIHVRGGYLTVDIDKFSRYTEAVGIHGNVINEGVGTVINGLTKTTGVASMTRGMQNDTQHSLIDGSMEAWWYLVGAPYRPYRMSIQSASILSRETTIKRFGNASLKVEIAGGQSRGGAYFQLDGDLFKEYARPDAVNYRNGVYQWDASGLGTNEYYVQLSGGGDPSIDVKPYAVWVNGTPTDEGAVGALANLEWDYGDNDALGFNTIYVRNNGGDVDTEALAYIEGCHKYYAISMSGWAYTPVVNGGVPTLYIRKSGGVGSSYNSSNFTISAEQWTHCTVTFPLDPSRTRYDFIWGMYNQAAGSIVYWDGAELVQGVASTPVVNRVASNDSYYYQGFLRLPSYSDAIRPVATDLPAGAMIWNTDDDAPNFSDGTNWLDAAGGGT